MTIERTDIMDDEAKKAAQEAEAQRQREVSEAREAAHKAEVDRARAEGELEAVRKAQQAPQPQPQAQAWTEEQWQAAEAQTGLTKQQLMASWNMAQTATAQATKVLEDRLKATEERAANAEAESKRLSSRRSADSTVSEFYDQKPALKQYRKEVDEFLADVPEADRQDPQKMAKWLGRAETYVRGVVGSKMQREQGGGRSANLGEEHNEEGEGGQSEKLDFTGLESKSQRRLIADVASDLASRDKSEMEALKAFQSSDGLGIRIDAEAEFAEGTKILSGGRKTFGGSRA